MFLSKLNWYGISTHWFQDYFTDRTQSMRSSAVLTIYHGIIQGSNLGPVMFTLFTNDISCHLSSHASIVSYADDAQIIHSAPPTPAGLTELQTRVENDLGTLAKWFTSNGLKGNPSKIEIILFDTPATLKKLPDFALSFGEVQVKPVSDMKVLDVQLDGELNVKKHTGVEWCDAATVPTLITVSNISGMLPKKTLIRLKESLVFSHIAYCLPAWVPPTQKQRDRIQKVINFAVRIVFKKKKWDHFSEPRKKLGWMDFETQVKYRHIMCNCVCITFCTTPTHLRAWKGAYSSGQTSVCECSLTAHGRHHTADCQPPDADRLPRKRRSLRGQ